MSRGVGSPPACRRKFGIPPQFSPPGSSEMSALPQEVFVISVLVISIIVEAAWLLYHNVKSPILISYLVKTGSFVILKLLWIKCNIQNNLYLTLLLNEYHFQNYLCSALVSSPLPDPVNFDPPKESSSASQIFHPPRLFKLNKTSSHNYRSNKQIIFD